MYRWNKQLIKKLIKYLQSIDSDNQLIKDDLEILKDLYKQRKDSDESIYNLYYENEEYEKLKRYNNKEKIIANKYFNDDTDEIIKYETIKSNKKDILLFTRDNIKNIDKNWVKQLEPHIFTKTNLDFNKNNSNRIIYLEYLKKYFITLSKNNNITDFINPTHEFLHLYTLLLNPKFLNSIEYEFLSILGEMITSYEMKKKNMFNDEVIKTEMESYLITMSYIKTISYKKLTIFEDINYDSKIYFLSKIVKLNKKDIKDMYQSSLEYNYSVVLSYFLAIELFEIYKKDKEKCIYICERIIKSNDDLYQKLRDNNISLLNNDDNYIRKLKKEYYK